MLSFKWYRQDFEQGWRGLHTLSEFFVRHAAALALSTEQLAALKSNSIDIWGASLLCVKPSIIT